MDLNTSLMFDTARAQAFNRTPRAPVAGSPEKIKEAAKQFEAVFATQMLQPIFEGISTDGMFGGGHAESIYRSFLVQEISDQIAERGGFGIAEAVAREMLSLQEANSQEGQP